MNKKESTRNSAAPPSPAPMPVDAQEWAKRLDLSNFVNAYYQFRDLQGLPHCRKLLIVGPGQGLASAVLRWRQYEVTTLDIDATFNPDVIGSVHDLSQFATGQFDAVIASHVLEHLSEDYLEQALSEIARVGHFGLVYLPVNGVYTQLRFQSNFRALDLSLLLTVSKWFERPSRSKPLYMDGQHYWEIGLKGFKVRDLLRRMEACFEVLRTYRNKDWLPSQNFVLRSKRHT